MPLLRTTSPTWSLMKQVSIWCWLTCLRILSTWTCPLDFTLATSQGNRTYRIEPHAKHNSCQSTRNFAHAKICNQVTNWISHIYNSMHSSPFWSPSITTNVVQINSRSWGQMFNCCHLFTRLNFTAFLTATAPRSSSPLVNYLNPTSHNPEFPYLLGN